MSGIEVLQFGQTTNITRGILRNTNWSSPAVGNTLAGRIRHKLYIESLTHGHGDSGGPVWGGCVVR